MCLLPLLYNYNRYLAAATLQVASSRLASIAWLCCTFSFALSRPHMLGAYLICTCEQIVALCQQKIQSTSGHCYWPKNLAIKQMHRQRLTATSKYWTVARPRLNLLALKLRAYHNRITLQSSKLKILKIVEILVGGDSSTDRCSRVPPHISSLQ
jgi:hypothetical protein